MEPPCPLEFRGRWSVLLTFQKVRKEPVADAINSHVWVPLINCQEWDEGNLLSPSARKQLVNSNAESEHRQGYECLACHLRRTIDGPLNRNRIRNNLPCWLRNSISLNYQPGCLNSRGDA